MAVIFNDDNTFLKFKTPHYSYQMIIKQTKISHRSYNFLVGNKETPCLEGTIILENITNNERYNRYEYTATLNNIDALTECSLDDISTDYQNTYSFGKELLDSLIFFINSQFPKIKTVKLTDMSIIPCNRKENHTLDLLSYSIALYGKTWYEKVANAYILPKDKYEKYRNQIQIYMDKNTKSDITFDLFYNTMLFKNHYTQAVITEHYDQYKNLYETSSTFPEFFIKINNIINREDKCKFFKTWLYDFIASQIIIEREWYIDLFPKIEVLSKLNYNNNKTRKNRTHNRNNNKN
jgi:hypothetical protein